MSVANKALLEARSGSLLRNDLIGFGSINLWRPAITRDLAGDAHVLVAIFRFGCTELGAVFAPN